MIYRSAALIGRQLAVVGDDINNRYAPEFSQMIRMLHLTPETAYEAFAGVARKYVRVFYLLSFLSVQLVSCLTLISGILELLLLLLLLMSLIWHRFE